MERKPIRTLFRTITLLGFLLATASVKAEPSFAQSLQTIRAEIQSPELFGPSNCKTYLKTLTEQFNSIDPDGEFAQNALSTPNESILALWNLQTTLHHRLVDLGKACTAEVKFTFRILRSSIDWIAEATRSVTPLHPDQILFSKQKTPFLEESPDYLVLQNPAFPEKLSFQAGDVWITRGVSFVSATISRVGDQASQFSHVVFVDQSEKDGKPRTIESYIGKGVLFYNLPNALKNENARILILRAKDPKLAHDAASYMRKRVATAIENGKPIGYDFKFDFENHDALSCAEVVQDAYLAATYGALNLPTHRSMISSKKSFIERFGLKEGETFEPGDMETDPNFEIVAEFRDLRITRDSRIKDAVLSTLIRWTNADLFELHDTRRTAFAYKVVWPMRQTKAWPLFRKLLGLDDFPAEVPRLFFKNVSLINDVGTLLSNYLWRLDDLQIKTKNRPMTFNELTAKLERAMTLSQIPNEKGNQDLAVRALLRNSRPYKPGPK